MGDLKAPPDQSAVHLCLDMQRLFGPEGPWRPPWMERVLPIVISIVERAPARTIFTRFVPPSTADDAHRMWRAYYKKWKEVTRANLDPDLIDLMPELQKTGVNTLIVTGAETDVCVLSTILAAVDLGYRIIVVKDGLCSSSDQTHDALLGLYAQRFDLQVELTQANELLEVWRG